jgi:hypothetical protein
MERRLVGESGLFLNHVEMVYRPGERELTGRALELLGCEVVDSGGHWLLAKIDRSSPSTNNNVLYASEVPEEQWAFETALQERLASGDDLAAAYRAFQEFQVRRPQFATHFGIRLPSMDAWREAIARVEECDDPGLRGRLSLSGEFHPRNPGAYSPDLAQAFVKTDIFAAGLVTLGQHIELQVVDED